MEQNKAESLYLELIPNLPGKESNLAEARGTWYGSFPFENPTTLLSPLHSHSPPPLLANSAAISFPVRSFRTNLRLETSEVSFKNSERRKRRRDG